MRRPYALILAVALLVPAGTALAADEVANHPVKTLEKILRRCEADRAKREGDKLAEAQAECSADLTAFFRDNPPMDLPDELKISLQDIVISGYVSLGSTPEQFGWDINQNQGTGG